MTRDPIIEKPHAQSSTQRFTQGAVTITFWVGFVFLLRPVFSLIAWIVGVVFFSRAMVVNDGFHAVVRLLGWYGLAILAIAATLKGWAWYNYRRFGGRNMRRTFAPPVPLKDIAAFNQVDPVELSGWQKARWLLIRHDPQGRILQVSERQFGLDVEPDLPANLPEEAWQAKAPSA